MKQKTIKKRFFSAPTAMGLGDATRRAAMLLTTLMLTIFTTPTEAWAETIDLSTVTIATVAQNGDVVTGTLANNVKISIANNATVTLSGVSINADGAWNSGDYAGFTCEGDATIILADGTTNTVKSIGDDYPGIYVPKDHTLTIQGGTAGTGKLIASSNGYGAGIGGAKGYGNDCGHISITGGIITATGGVGGAGIGCGCADNIATSCGNISISGGNVIATGGNGAAGIGCSRSDDGVSNCGNITITGGTIVATGGDHAAGIGGGCHQYNELKNKSKCGDITITTAVTSITAKAGSSAPYCIGAGYGNYGEVGTVTVKGVTGNVEGPKYQDPVVDTYTVVFDKNGGIGTMDDQTITSDAPAQLDANAFTREGYVFVCWNTATDGTGICYADQASVTNLAEKDGSVTLYAQWFNNDLSTLTVDYTVPDGTVLTGTLTSNVKISIANNATVTFNGVTIGSEYGSNNTPWAGITCEGNAIIVLADGSTNTVTGLQANYPAIFVPQNSTLTIQGGTVGTGSLTANTTNGGSAAAIGGGYRISCGNIIINGGTITANGYYHSAAIGGGWNANCGDITITTSVKSVTASVQSGSNTFHIIGAGNSGTVGTVTIGGVVTGGISKSETISTITYDPTINTGITISYDANGGSGTTMASQGLLSGIPIALNANTYTAPTGYTAFAGWATMPDGEKVYDDEQIVNNLTGTNGAATLYAKWTPTEYNITYELYGGTNAPNNPTTYTIESNDITLAEPIAPENSGYTFGGWYTDPDFSPSVSDTDIPSSSTGDFKFYAKWLKSITVPVIWDDNNNLDDKRPISVEVYLLANEEPIEAITVSGENEWEYTFENMPVHHSGEEIIYTISVPDNMPDLYDCSIVGTDITFTRKTGDLTVTNTVTNSLEYNKEFTFTVTLPLEISGTFGEMNFNNGVATFTLKNGESLTAAGLPTSLVYTVTVNHEVGFTPEESEIKGLISTGPSIAAFTHTYSAVGSVTLEAKANVENQYLQNKNFSFNLLDAYNNVIQQNVEQNNETGKATFAPINYTLADLGGNQSKEFVYIIEQVIPEGAVPINGLLAYDGVAYEKEPKQVTVTVTDNGNGTLGVLFDGNTDFTIPEWYNKVVATVTADDLSKVYGENDPELTAKVKVGDIIINEGINYSLSREEGDDVGNYVITPVGDPIQGDYTIICNPGMLTISKAPLTVTAKDHSIFYGNAADNDGVEYSGFVNDETENVLGGGLTYTYSNANGAYGEGNDAPGEYDIIPVGLTSNNYEIAFVPGKLTVNPVIVKVRVVDKGDGEPIVGLHVVVRIKSTTETNGKIIHEWYSTKEGHIIEGIKAGGEYTIMGNEYMGYTRSAEYTLTIDENGNVSYSGTIIENDVLLVENSKTKVEISVVDMVDGDNKLEGATVQVIDSEGVVVEEWVSETENHIIEGLTIFEEYTLCETVAPNGYAAPAAYKFKIDTDGTVTTTGGTTTTDEEGKNTVLVLENPFTVPLFAANSSNLWMTWCDKYDYEKPEGVTVYTVSGVENNTVTLEKVSDVIPAYTPVLLYREAAGDDAVTATFSAVGTEPEIGYDNSSGIVEANISDNVTLYGNSGDGAYDSGSDNNIFAVSESSAIQSYVLLDGQFVLVDYDEGISAHRCWLNVTKSTTNGARLLSIKTDSESTGIETTNFTNSANSSGAWYGIDGRKLDGKPTKKGLYIYNGKKQVIK